MSFLTDLRDSSRILRHEPGFAAVAILTVAVGIGANTAIFSIVNGVLLRPLPYSDPDRLVTLREVVPQLAETYPTLPVSAHHFTEWRKRSTSFAHLSAIDPSSMTLTGGECPPERHLDEAIAVPQIHEDQAAQVPAPVYPPAETYLLTRVLGTQLPARVSAQRRRG